MIFRLLSLVLLINLLFSCNNVSVQKPIKSTKVNVNQLRKLYSSGKDQWPSASIHPSAKEGFQDIGHLPNIVFPSDNPYSKEKELLGKTLFFDPRFSSSKHIACASCHDPENSWNDNRTFSFGHDRQLGNRNAMTLLNVAFVNFPFWDGRARSLEHQAEMPVQDPKEMNEHIDLAVDKIANIKGYEKLFIEAFGDKTFERTIKSGSTKFDRFIDGEKESFTDQEVLGLHLFRTKAQCINCHNTGYFSNNKFENDGTSLLGTKQEDLGRYAVTKQSEDIGKFRVPTLREVSRTGPWMHNGAFPNLRDVITFYNSGNPEVEKKRNTTINGESFTSQKSVMLKPLLLTKEEIIALEAFLTTLSSKSQRISPPVLPQ